MKHDRQLLARYAEAIVHAMTEEDQQAAWLTFLQLAQQLISNPSISASMADPRQDRSTKLAWWQRLWSQLNFEPTASQQKLLVLIAHQQRWPLLVHLYDAVQALCDKRAGIVRAQVTLAAAIDDQQQAALAQWMTHQCGQAVHITATVDPSLLGGMMITYGDWHYDGSVRGQLAQLLNKAQFTKKGQG